MCESREPDGEGSWEADSTYLPSVSPPCSRESLHSPLPSHHAIMDDAPLPVPPVPAPAPAPAPPAAAPRVPFHCSECGKSFRYRSDLRRHFARHTALKPHACPRCGKGFKHSFNLANHLRSHTGERPYRCSACPKGFRDSTGLLHHQVSPTAGRRLASMGWTHPWSLRAPRWAAESTVFSHLALTVLQEGTTSRKDSLLKICLCYSQRPVSVRHGLARYTGHISSAQEPHVTGGCHIG